MRRSILLVAAAAVVLEAFILSVFAQDCPLDLTWSNYTEIASACSDRTEFSICCRYINALVTVSVAMYANTTGTDTLGVPPALSDTCISTINETLISKGIPSDASTICGLGVKIQVVYSCQGMSTIQDVLLSPNFGDVKKNCNGSILVDAGCKRCLNSGLSYLRHLMEGQDNVTLNTCRDAAFVAVANQQSNLTPSDMATCFFSVQGLSLIQVPSISVPAHATAPATWTADAPAQHLITTPVIEQHHRGHKIILLVVIGIMVTGLAFLLVLILVLLISRKRRELKSMEGTENTYRASPPIHVQKSQEVNSTIHQNFSYKEMRRATTNFSVILGRGSNGAVYKGQLDDGSKVAIKCIRNNITKYGEEEFCREMELLARLHHRHLVSLKGFCFVKDERFLVYEYMENGSLKDHLHASDKAPLTWQTRIQIAVDIANALEYLHFYCDPSLCHGDIKSSNVLLASNFLAKVSDFGHACFSNDLKIHGTPGYVDPEYVATHQLTPSSDVYSFGVLLLELITGKPAVYNGKNLVDWASQLLSDDSTLIELGDPRIIDSFDLSELEAMIEIIQWCTQKEGRERPCMKQVIRMLSERWDPLHGEFARAVEIEEGQYCNYGYSSGNKRSTGKEQRGEGTPFSSDVRGLQSSSSTSRSYCSRSALLEGNASPPDSPRGIFSL
ncbi:putative receptor-like protein kinase [Carex littledalei]|uniref:Putative receptor-like protein kinase n=1 Tax=Carex littledalei TaxID=544730 RepID=A0A833QXR9_9POAL|nr:putative receptor-like protein kinase [Carex littledalei]